MEEVKKEPLKEAEETKDLGKPEESSSEATPVGIKESEEITGFEESSVKDDSKDASDGFEDTPKGSDGSEDTPKGSDGSEDDSKDSEESTPETQKLEESEESTESSLKVVSQGIKVSSEESVKPEGVTDEELSRVFAAIPRKSKVALDRVESKMNSVKDFKSSPSWYPWVFSLIMIVGLIWAVVYYLTGNYPIPHIGAWNLVIAFVTILVGFAMTMAWK